MKLKVLIRGAGEMASGVGLRLHRSGFSVVYTEIEAPLCVRRTVSFCEAVIEGMAVVEDAEAHLIRTPRELDQLWAQKRMAVIVDPELDHLKEIHPDVVVDAMLAKRNIGTNPNMAELVIALGPGFSAGQDAHVVIETNRGHDLGRLIYQGQAEENTGQPGEIGGETQRRVLRAPVDGLVQSDLSIGDQIQSGQSILRVNGRSVRALIPGVLRGLIRPGLQVEKGLKLGDIDPRGQEEACFTVSDKARAIGGSVLEAILHHFNR